MTRMAFRRGLLAAGLTMAAVAACAPAAKDVEGDAPAAAVSSEPSTRPPDKLSIQFEQALPNVKGKTFTSAVVDYPPNGSTPPHHHGQAFVYAYVLKGAVRSQLAGEAVHTYRQGDYWIEPPGAHHVLSENASRTEPARLLVVFVSNTGEAIKVNDPSS
ncbi:MULTISPECIES: cupin domain-containing protein [Streptomycetaceae]|uniref:cupin domain-containing protein n=1 Tax=Streptomycetaceae TaxID=2062 RepID=UPI00039EBA3B|nr:MULTISPECIES: cupin domain-containing protein [Streptomycetaceae]